MSELQKHVAWESDITGTDEAKTIREGLQPFIDNGVNCFVRRLTTVGGGTISGAGKKEEFVIAIFTVTMPMPLSDETIHAMRQTLIELLRVSESVRRGAKEA